jgi:hypothetical protein
VRIGAPADNGAGVALGTVIEAQPNDVLSDTPTTARSHLLPWGRKIMTVLLEDLWME